MSAGQHTPSHHGDGRDGSRANVRANAYAILSSLIRDASDHAAVRRFIVLWESLGADHGELGPRSTDAAHRFCEIWERNDSQVSLQRRREFARLFLSRRSIHPYESVYLGARKRLMDDPWVEVCAFYREAGMQKGPEELHPEDHLSVELGFMACLAFLTDLDLSGLERRFLDEHLVRWVPQVCRDIEARPDASSYRVVARFTRAMVEEDHARFCVPAGH